MADCAAGITKDITSNCTTQPVGGVEVTAYAMNRKEIDTVTYDVTDPNKITAITMQIGKQAYNIFAAQKGLDCGHDRLAGQAGFEDVYTHYAKFMQFERKAADILNVDDMKDICIIFEYKEKTDDGDGVFPGYGFKSGLYVSTDTKRANAAQGTRNIELTTAESEGEDFSEYVFDAGDVASSRLALEALLTPAT
jgi:hypothetical protein